MHSTLQEIRLVQRSLKSSCRYCSVRNQSPRRAFHRGSALQTGQEPGNTPGNSPAASSGHGKDGQDTRPPVAYDLPASKPPTLPLTPPSLSRSGSTQVESDQNLANAFYGSSFNRRQRVRAQQDANEPAFATPQWFADNNVTLWSESGRNDGIVERTDEWNFEVLSRGGTPSGSDEPGAQSPPSAGDGSPIEQQDQPRDRSQTPGLESSASTANNTKSSQGPRYYIGANQWDEISTTTRGLLKTTTSNTQYQSEPAVKANNLLLHYAGRDGEYFLDEVVQQLAAENGSDLLDIDVQDVADLVSRARARDPSAAEGRMLSYDLLTSPGALVESTEKYDDPPDDDEMDAAGFEIPFPGGGSNPPMLIGKPFTIDLSNLGNLFGSRGSRTGRKSTISDALSGSGSKMQPYGQNFRMLSPPSGPFYSLAESMLAAVHEERQCHQPYSNSRRQLTEKHGLPLISTIVHIKDVKAIQNTPMGSQFLGDFYAAVEAKRSQGENIVIVGTECSKESTENHTSNIDSLQRTPMPAEISRTIVITPMVPNKRFQDNLLEDRRRRIAAINMRHIWEMMSVWETSSLSSSEHFLGLKPGFWKGDFYNRLTDLDKLRLSKQVWSFQYVHRVVSYLRGLSSYTDFLQDRDTIEQDKVLPIINAVASKLSLSDGSKVAWAEYHTKSTSDSFEARNPKTAKKMEDFSKLNRIRKAATKHEKRLLNGVIEPGKISTTFDDVHVPPETIEALQTLTTLSVVNPEAFSYGVLASDRIPGLLLYGPPGTGKTLLAKAVAKESGATMLEVSAADLNDMYVGEGEKNVKALFSLAKKLSPCVVFLDEADAMFSARSAAGRRVSHRELLNQFLKEWDGMSNDAGSAFLMVATNRPMDFDDAVLRRLPRRLLIDLPTESDRHEILKIHLRAERVADDLNLADLAKRTPFYSGSDLKNLCVAAALTAVREQVAAKKAASLSISGQTNGSESTTDASAPSTSDLSSDIKLGTDSSATKLPNTTNTAAEGYTAADSRRVLTTHHFAKALEEITSSVSEDMNSLKEIKKFDEVYGDKKGRKRKVPKWGFRSVGDADVILDTVKVRQ